MSVRAAIQSGVLTLVLLLGIGLGLVLSVEAWPATCSSAAPYELSRHSRCLWMAWSADAYIRDRDLDRARDRLILLGENQPTTLCALVTGDCVTCRPSQQAAGAELAQALGVTCGE